MRRLVVKFCRALSVGLVVVSFHSAAIASSAQIPFSFGGVNDKNNTATIDISSNSDDPQALAIDSSGNFYIGGDVKGEDINFSANFTNANTVLVNTTQSGIANTQDGYLASYDANGILRWVLLIQGNNDDLEVTAVTTDVAGNVYVTGIYDDTIAVNLMDSSGSISNISNYTSPSSSKATFIAKLTSSGSVTWFKTIGEDSSSSRAQNKAESTSIQLDSGNNIYLAGGFYGTVDFDPSDSTSYTETSRDDEGGDNDDAYVVKLTSNGDFIWVRVLGSDNDDDVINALAVDSSDNVFIGGMLSSDSDGVAMDGNLSTTEFDARTDAGRADGSGTDSSDDFGFIQKLNGSDGSLLWSKVFLDIGSTGGDSEVTGLSFDSVNNRIVTAGTYDDSIDFNPSFSIANSSTAEGDFDLFVVSLDNSGNYLWHATLGNLGQDTDEAVDAVHVSSNGDIYLAADLYGSSFGISGTATNIGNWASEIPASAGDQDAVILKLQSSGAIQWARVIGGVGYDTGDYFAEGPNGNVYLTGQFKQQTDLDPTSGVFSPTTRDRSVLGDTAQGNNGRDAFLIKLTSAGVFVKSDTTPPNITNVTIPDTAHKVGDTVTVTITVDTDTETYTLDNSSTVAGLALSNFTKVDDTTYTAEFTIADSGTDINGSSDIPVNLIISDMSGNSSTYNTAISQANDPIYANLPVLSLAVNTYNMMETGSLTMTVAIALNSSLNGVWPEDITLHMVYSNTATRNSDYTAPDTIVISAGDTSGTGEIVGQSDVVYEGPYEQITATMSSASAGTINTLADDFILTLNELQNQPTFSLTAADDSISENAGSTAITASISNATYEDVTVSIGIDLSATNAAVLATDFEITGSYTTNNLVLEVVIPQGQLSASITVAALDDGSEEGDEVFSLSVPQVNGGDVFYPTPTFPKTITISDDDLIAPTLTSITGPTAATYIANNTLAFTANFSEPVNVDGATSLYLLIGDENKSATYVSGSGSTAIVFEYPIEAGLLDSDGIVLQSFIMVADGIEDVLGSDFVDPQNYALDLSGVLVDAVGPSVTSVTAVTADGAYPEGGVIQLVVNFDESTVVVGAPELLLETGVTDNAATYTSGSNTNGLTFSYTIQAGDENADLGYHSTVALNLNGATITDTHGNAATLTLPAPGSANSLRANHAIVLDTEQPTVTMSTDDTGVKAGETTTVRFTLSEASSTFSGNDVDVVGGSLSQFTGSATSFSALFIPDENYQNNASFDVAAAAFTDAAGNNNLQASTHQITVDTVRPTIYFSADNFFGVNAEGVTIYATSNQPITGFEVSDIIVTNGVITDFSGSGTNYTAKFTPTPSTDDQATFNIATDSVTNAAGNGNLAATQMNIFYDAILPTVTITSAESVLGGTGSTTLTFTLSETTSAFTQSDISVANGSISNFSGSGLTYTATFTPDSSFAGDATVDVLANGFQDTTGNDNAASVQLSITVDSLSPTVTITSDDATLKAGETTTVFFNLSENSTDFGENDVDVVGGSLSQFSGSDSTYSALFTPNQNYQSNASFDVAAAAFTDAVGNNNLQANSHQIAVDTIRPTIYFSADNFFGVNAEGVTIYATSNQFITGFEVSDIIVTNGVISDFSGSGTNYTAKFTPTPGTDDQATFNIATDSVTNAAGNGNLAATQMNIFYDAMLPSVTISSADSVLGEGASTTVTFTLSETSSMFTESDISVANGTITNFSGSGLTYTATFTPSSGFFGDATIDVSENIFQDTVGNNNAAATQLVIGVDGVSPTVTITADATSVLAGETVTINFDLSEVSSNFEASDIVVSGIELSNFSGSGQSYTATYTPANNFTGDGTLAIPSGGFTDIAGNDNMASSQLVLSVDAVIPSGHSVAIDQDEIANDNRTAMSFTLSDGEVGATFSYVISDGTDQVSSGTDVTITGSSQQVTDIDVSGLADTNLTLTLTVEDPAGNQAMAVTDTVQKVNYVAPVANADNVSTDEDQQVQLDLLANDTDVDDDMVATSVVIQQQPTKGQVTIIDGVMTYTPDADENGSDSLSYTVKDEKLLESDAATVTVEITPINDAPEITSTPTAVVTVTDNFSYAPIATDVDSSSLSWQVKDGTSLPSWLSLGDGDTAANGFVDTPLPFSVLGVRVSSASVMYALQESREIKNAITVIEQGQIRESEIVITDMAESDRIMAIDLHQDVLYAATVEGRLFEVDVTTVGNSATEIVLTDNQGDALAGSAEFRSIDVTEFGILLGATVGGSQQILSVPLGGTQQTASFAQGSGDIRAIANHLTGVYYARGDHVYFVDGSGTSVEKYTTRGSGVTELVFDDDGDLYMTDSFTFLSTTAAIVALDISNDTTTDIETNASGTVWFAGLHHRFGKMGYSTISYDPNTSDFSYTIEIPADVPEFALSGVSTQDDIGSHDVCLTVSDSIDITEHCFTVLVNGYPSLLGIDNLSVDEEQDITFAGIQIADDSDTVSLTIQISDVSLANTEDFTVTAQGAAQVSQDSSTNAYTIEGSVADVQATLRASSVTLVTDFFGTIGFDVALEDSYALASPVSEFSYTVNDVNDAPVALIATALTMAEDNNGQLSWSFNDIESDDTTIAITTQGTHGNASIVGDTLVYTPNEHFHGTDTVIVTLTDARGAETNHDISVAVTSVNDDAVISGTDTGSTNEDLATAVSGTLIVADVDQGESNFILQIDAQGTYGIFSLTAEGAWSYVLDITDATVQALVDGDSTLEDSFVASSFDQSATQTVTITITGLNDTAVISGTAVGSTNEDDATSVSGTLLIIDADSGQGIFNAVTDGAAQFGSFTVTADGQWSYSLDNSHGVVQSLALGEPLTDTFAVTSSDGSATETVTITVTGQNDAATISGINQSAIDEDASEAISGELTIADIDNDESSVVAQSSTVGQYGTFSITAAGDWRYTIDNSDMAVQSLATGDTLSDVFTVTSVDQTDSYSVTVTINGVNDIPVIAGVSTKTTDEDTVTVVTGALTITDVDSGGAEFTPATEVVADYGTFSLATDGQWTYALDTGNDNVQSLPVDITLTDSFTAVSKDGSQSQQVTVTIVGVNDVATIAGVFVGGVTEDTLQTVTGQVNVSDVDNSEAIVAVQDDVSGDYGNFSVTSTGNWEYVLTNTHPSVQALASGSTLTDSFNLMSLDGTATEQVTITITGVNDLAVIAGTSTASVAEDNNIAISGSLTISDVDTGEALFAAQAQYTASYGVFELASNGDWSYTLDTANNAVQSLPADVSLTDSFIAVSADGGSSQQVTVTIIGQNDAAVISGVTSGGLLEDTQEAVTGTLSVTDVDTGETVFIPQTSTVGDYGAFSITADGNWDYSLDNNQGAVQSLPNGEVLTDTFNAVSVDSTATQSVTITITGINDIPTISGVSTGTIGEDAVIAVSDSLTTTDTDSGESGFIEQVQTTGLYGLFSIAFDGVWQYVVDTVNAAVLALTSDETLEERFTVVSADGTTTDTVVVTIDGDNDAATFAGVFSGAVAEDTQANAKGQITVTDIDNPNTFITQTSEGSYGTLTVNEIGQWHYQLNQTNPEVQALAEGQSLLDDFTLTATDGTETTVNVTVNGDNDKPVAVDDSFEFTRTNNDRYLLDVLSNDSDTDDAELTISGVEPSIGTAIIVDNQIQFEASTQFSGEVQLGYSVADNEGLVDRAIITLTIDNPLAEGPSITVPADVSVNATGLYTRVELGVAQAVDALNRSIAVSLTDNRVLFAPGKHLVYWTATDEAGNTTIAEQVVNVAPMVSLSKNRRVAEGTEQQIDVVLNGQSPVYPLTIPYTVSGDADDNDHTLISGSVIINEGTRGSIAFSILADGSTEANELIIVTLGDALNRAPNFTTQYTIEEGNLAPSVLLTSEQGGEERSQVTSDGDNVTVVLQASDQNLGDALTVQWQSDVTPIETTDSQLVFAIEDLSVGLNSVSVIVTDNGTPSLSTTEILYFDVIETIPELSADTDSDGDLIPDSLEGNDDSDNDGIPDYLDAIDECNVLPASVDDQTFFLSEGEPGVCLRKGPVASVATSGGLEITDENGELTVIEEDQEYTAVNGLFDYIAYGLPTKGQAYHIVFAQLQPIPNNAIYRKYNSTTGWKDFEVDDENQVYSAAGEKGICPPPKSDVWSQGLTAGHWCVQLKITDGGPNDDDGEANGTVMDPGGVAVLRSDNTLPSAVDDAVESPWNRTIDVAVLDNDSDADGDALNVTSVTADYGVASVNSDNTIRYEMQPFYAGVVTITYGVTDANGGTSYADLVLTIVGNEAPVTADDSASTDDRQVITVNVLANDTDEDGDALFVVSAEALHGSVLVNADNTLTYTPYSGVEGMDTVTYVISDGYDTAQGTLSITINAWESPLVKNSQSGGTMNLWFVLLSLLALVQRYRRTVQFRYLLMAMAVALTPAAHSANDGIQLVGISIGKGYAKTSFDSTRLPSDASLVALKESGQSSSIVFDFAWKKDWTVQAGYVYLGATSATIQGDTLSNSADFHQRTRGLQPALGSGIQLGVSHSFWQDSEQKLLLQGGVFVHREDRVSTLNNQVSVYEDNTTASPYVGLSSRHLLNDTWSLEFGVTQYWLDEAARNFSIGLYYRFD